MALRAAIERLRSSCCLQLRTLAQTSQDTRKAFTRGCTVNASTDEGTPLEHKLENPELSSESSDTVHGTENVVEPDKAEFEASIKVGAPYLRFVVGKRGSTKASIEMATKTRFRIPPANKVKNYASLVVKGESQESVDTAVTSIRNLLERAERNSNFQYSHFISLPLASHEDLVKRVRSLRDSIIVEEDETNSYVSWFPESAEKESSNVAVVNPTNKVPKIKASYVLDPDLEGFFSDDELSDDENELSGSAPRKITSSLFIKPETFHITVLMLKLFTDERVNLAAEVLQDAKSKVLEILDGHEPKVHLKGIECFRGIPVGARVLCMKVEEVDPGNYLERACQVIKDAYVKAGLVANVDKRQEIKLHATLMNTNGRRPFDARKILAAHRLEDWGHCSINEVHLSQRFFYDESGYYRCCNSLKLSSPAPETSPALENSA